MYFSAKFLALFTVCLSSAAVHPCRCTPHWAAGSLSFELGCWITIIIWPTGHDSRRKKWCNPLTVLAPPLILISIWQNIATLQQCLRPLSPSWAKILQPFHGTRLPQCHSHLHRQQFCNPRSAPRLPQFQWCFACTEKRGRRPQVSTNVEIRVGGGAREMKSWNAGKIKSQNRSHNRASTVRYNLGSLKFLVFVFYFLSLWTFKFGIFVFYIWWIFGFLFVQL